MSKFNRKKIAVTLAFAALFGDKTSAASTNKNQVKSSQALAAVGGRPLRLIAQKVRKVGLPG